MQQLQKAEIVEQWFDCNGHVVRFVVETEDGTRIVLGQADTEGLSLISEEDRVPWALYFQWGLLVVILIVLWALGLREVIRS